MLKFKFATSYKFFEEELSVEFGACQQQSNDVDCRFYSVANVFHSPSAIHISTKITCEDQVRAHLLKCIKSGQFTLSKPEQKELHYHENLIKFDEFSRPALNIPGTSPEYPLKVLTFGTSRGYSGAS